MGRRTSYSHTVPLIHDHLYSPLHSFTPLHEENPGEADSIMLIIITLPWILQKPEIVNSQSITFHWYLSLFNNMKVLIISPLQYLIAISGSHTTSNGILIVSKLVGWWVICLYHSVLESTSSDHIEWFLANMSLSWRHTLRKLIEDCSQEQYLWWLEKKLKVGKIRQWEELNYDASLG